MYNFQMLFVTGIINKVPSGLVDRAVHGIPVRTPSPFVLPTNVVRTSKLNTATRGGGGTRLVYNN